MDKAKGKKFTAAIVLLIVAVFCLFGFLFSKYLWFDFSYDESINEYCTAYGVEKEIVYAVIKAESGFDENAVSQKGAVGLMQIMPNTAAYVAQIMNKDEFDLKEPKQNLQIGIYYLSYLFSKFDYEKEVLAAYNAGETTVTRWLNDKSYSENGRLKQIPYAETDGYVNKVLTYKKMFKTLHN